MVCMWTCPLVLLLSLTLLCWRGMPLLTLFNILDSISREVEKKERAKNIPGERKVFKVFCGENVGRGFSWKYSHPVSINNMCTNNITANKLTKQTIIAYYYYEYVDFMHLYKLVWVRGKMCNWGPNMSLFSLSCSEHLRSNLGWL